MAVPLAVAAKTTCAPCAAHVAALRALATDHADGAVLEELDALAALVAERALAAARFEAPAPRPEAEDVDAQLRKLDHWLEGHALAHLRHEEVRLAVMLDERLDVLAKTGGRDRRGRAGRALESLLRERLDRWRALIEAQVEDAFRLLAHRLGASGTLSPESRLSYRLALPSGFLPASALLDAIVDAGTPRPYAWARLRKQLQADARLLLYANVTRIVDDLKQRAQDGAQRLVRRPLAG